MKTFTIDPELLVNSTFIVDLGLSSLYLKNDKENPWFVLVPRKARAVELIDLTHEEQGMLLEEVSMVSDFLMKYYRPTKLNIGALGNIVRQFHFHVIARYNTDRAWPQPLWGTTPHQFFEEFELENIKSNFLNFID